MGSVRKKGNRWYFTIELPPENGKRKHIERAGGRTKKEALQKMALLEAEIINKGYKEKSKITVSELLDIWFKEYVELNCKENTKLVRKRMINNHIKPELGSYNIADIKTRDIQRFLNNKAVANYSKSTINMLRAILNSLFKYAMFPLELLEVNPVRNTSIPNSTDVKEKHILTKEELSIILDNANRPFLKLIIEFAFNTGMRSSEIAGLCWKDVDIEKKIIHVRNNLIVTNGKKSYYLGSTKTKSSTRDIYIGDAVISVLKKQRKSQLENKLKYGRLYKKNKDNLVFTRENGSFIYNHIIADWIYTLSKKVNIPFSMHTLRHTHATLLLEAGVNAKDIQQRLGHKNINTTMDVYVKSTEVNQRRAVEIFENYTKNEKTSDI